ncbi:TetR/AcrR family transcriptional regulator [Sphingomonas sp. BK235]|jgi:AcrR family transcriptional regulator|uniref:TetR/AcrR family transcriptional regulator n=1 Tax=Sphingomonas sp. BK235 TaxID=2512131 RepID=UPI00104FB8F2|nr:TetR/AcrR family transcriptional regulator [Sphingomonas sp. BK235]TCP34988.1 TetR family transcriptional regulator [Sphingomonas sp. BK235]
MTDGISAAPGRPMRRDAQARRDALIAAARQCFARSGYLVPLEDIADAAGVGRGTLYRNFKDRMALALAIFEQEIERMRERLDPELPLDAALTHVVLEGASATALFTRLALDMPLDGADRAAFEGLRRRLELLFEPIAARAHRDGLLAPELGARDLVLAMRMLSGLLLKHGGEAERRQQLGDALRLLLVGLRPR